MNHEQIVDAIQQLSKELQLPSSKLCISQDLPCLFDDRTGIRYIDDSFFFLIQYRNNQAVEVAVDYELRNRLPILLYDMDFFKTPAEEVVTALKKLSSFTCDLEDEQLGTEYEFHELGLRLWREDAFHPKLLQDAEYRKEMELVMEEMYRYQYFELIGVH